MLKSLYYRQPMIMLILVNIIGFSLLYFYKRPYNQNILISGFVLGAICLISYGIILLFSLGDEYLFLIASMLISLGLIMLFRLNEEIGIKQMIWLGVGVLMFFLTYIIYMNIKILDRLMYVYLAASIVLFILTLALGQNTKGATNWIMIAGHSIQPSEFIKILFIFFIASFYEHPEYLKSITINFRNKSLIISSRLIQMAIAYIFMGFLVLQREWGTALLFFLVYFSLLYASETSFKMLFINLLLAIIVGLAGYKFVHHIQVRVETWLNPWADISGRGYQITQSLFAIGSGDFFGRGIGLGNPEFIPEVHTDFIFSAICEEMGIFGGVAIVMLFFILSYRGFKISMNVENIFHKTVALGITITFGFQTFIIIGGVIKLIPLTGITLPFISYGGSSLVASFISLGILQAISNMEFEFEKKDEIDVQQ